MPSLSLLIGGTSAVTVVIVAAVTLSITLTFSLRAIDDVAREHTDALANLARVKLDAYFSQPRDSAVALAVVAVTFRCRPNSAVLQLLTSWPQPQWSPTGALQTLARASSFFVMERTFKLSGTVVTRRISSCTGTTTPALV